MKFLLLFPAIAALALLIGAGAFRDEIRIYCIDPEIRPIVEAASEKLRDSSLFLVVVGEASEADVTAEYVDKLGDPVTAAVAYPLNGRIEMLRGADANILLHELIHCAGL